VRSISKFGLSQVVATFDDDTDIYDARQFIIERLVSVDLPDGIDRPQLGPISPVLERFSITFCDLQILIGRLMNSELFMIGL